MRWPRFDGKLVAAASSENVLRVATSTRICLQVLRGPVGGVAYFPMSKRWRPGQGLEQDHQDLGRQVRSRALDTSRPRAEFPWRPSAPDRMLTSVDIIETCGF